MLKGDRLRAMRKRSRYSQRVLADMVELSPRQISRYENVDVDVSATTLTKLSSVLNCSVDYLLGLVDEPNAHVPDIPPDVLKLARQFAALPKPYKEAIKAFMRAQAGNSNGKQVSQ